LWQNIGKGYVCESETCPEIEKQDNKEMRNMKNVFFWIEKKGNSIANVLINDFHSNYIVSSKENVQLNNVLNNSKRFERVVNSENNYFLYRVLPL
jgi:hypothetical protein